MKKIAYMGIDPGMNKNNPGCAAVWVPDTNYVAFCDWKDIKTSKETLINWNYQFYFGGVCLEKVLSHPKNGHRQAFKFGENYGMWQGLLTAMSINYSLVTPKTWQQIIPPIYRGTPKNRSINAAKHHLPGVEEFINKQKHNGRADALCMAVFIKERSRKLTRI